MSDHSSFSALATRLIKKHGRTINLVSHVMAGDDWNPTRIPVETPVKAVTESLNTKDLENNLVMSTDTAYLIDSSVLITTDMRINDCVDLAIISVETEKPGDQLIMHRVIARG